MSRSYSSAPLVIPPSKKHLGTVIFLHGLGDSGHGWEDAIQMIRPHAKHIKFILPHAPQRRITINMGERMPGWYDISSTNFGNRTDDAEGLKESQETVHSIIQEEVKSGIPEKNIIVGGFSQGAAVSLFTVFQYSKALAGCISLSGYIPMMATFPKLLNPSNQKTPILMYHGEMDGVIPYAFAQKSHETMKQMDLAVTFVTVPEMPHSVVDRELMHVARFINELIPNTN